MRCPEGDRPIEQLAVGDAIIAFDERNGVAMTGYVAAIHRAFVSQVRTVIAAGVRIEGISRSHPVFVVDRARYVSAEDLREGERLLVVGRDGRPREVVISKIEAREHPEPSIPVFNLTVGGAPPTFLAEGVLVHNKSIAVDCTTLQPRVRVEVALEAPCVGDRFPVRALRGPSYCTDSKALPAVFATSNPDLLVVDSTQFDPAVAIARGPGRVTITALHEGARGSADVVIADCSDDGGRD